MPTVARVGEGGQRGRPGELSASMSPGEDSNLDKLRKAQSNHIFLCKIKIKHQPHGIVGITYWPVSTELGTWHSKGRLVTVATTMGLIIKNQIFLGSSAPCSMSHLLLFLNTAS